MLGLAGDGLVVMTWAVLVLVFQDWVIRLDSAIRRLASGHMHRPPDAETERHRLVVTARVLLFVGAAAFVAGAFTGGRLT